MDKKENPFGNNLEWFHSFHMKIHKNLQMLIENPVSGGVPVHKRQTQLPRIFTISNWKVEWLLFRLSDYFSAGPIREVAGAVDQ